MTSRLRHVREPRRRLVISIAPIQYSPVGRTTPSVHAERTAGGLSRETPDGQDSSTRETTARRQCTGVAPAANATDSRAALEPTSYAPLKATEMTSGQIGLYVDIRKDALAVFAEALGTASAPAVSVESNGITWDRP